MAYNPSTAISYAKRWAFDRNPRYFDFDSLGGDCTNFISQCLYNGGYEMNQTRTFGWYYYSLSSRTPSWSGVEQLYSFIVNNNSAGPKGRDAGVNEVRLGDIIQLSFDGMTFRHSLLVVGFKDDTPLIACHTYDSYDRSLDSYIYAKARAIILDY